MDLTKEQQEQFAALLDIWRTDIAAFALDVFGVELRPKQIEFCHAFQNNKRITFKGGVGFGKTTVMAIIIWWCLFCHDRVKVSVFGPNEAQLKASVWTELESLWGRMDPFLKEQWYFTSEEIERKVNGADCKAMRRTANKDNVSSISGIHADNNFIFVDEASGVDDVVFEQALQNHLTSDINPKLVLISNPKYARGFFYRTWMDDDISGLWTKVHGKMADNPLVTPEDLEAAAKQYGGKGSNQYIINVEGDFPADDLDGLISSRLIVDAIENENAIPSENRPVIWGVDPAGPGKDRSVIIKRHDNKVLEMPIERRGMTITQLSYLVRDMYLALSPRERERVIVAVDANGLGRGLADNLKDFGLPVRAVLTQSSPTRGKNLQGVDKFAKLRDQLWWETKEWFETENVSIPNCTDLVKELQAPTYQLDDKGRIKVEGKQDLRKRLKASPDYADALCLTFAVDEHRYVGKYAWSKPIDYGDLSWLQ